MMPHFTVPTSIDATGKKDVSNPMQRFLNSLDGTAADPALVLFPRGARYRCEETMELAAKDHVWIDMNKATLLAKGPSPDNSKADRTRAHWRITGGTGVKVFNGFVVGPNVAGGLSDRAYQSELEAQHGFDIVGAIDPEVYGMDVRNVFGDFVYLGMNDHRDVCQGANVHDNLFTNNGRQGVSITGAIGTRLEWNHILEVRRTMVDIEPTSLAGVVEDTLINHNIFGRHRLNLVGCTGLALVQDMIISHNHCVGDTMQMVFRGSARPGVRRKELQIYANGGKVPYGNPEGVLIQVDDWTNVRIHNNKNPLQHGRVPTMQGVRFRGCSDAEETENDWS